MKSSKRNNCTLKKIMKLYIHTYSGVKGSAENVTKGKRSWWLSCKLIFLK